MRECRRGVGDIIASGCIVHWRDASEWRRHAREDVGEVSLKAGYARAVVSQPFDQVVNTPGSDARVVSGKRGLAAGGDDRETCLPLFGRTSRRSCRRFAPAGENGGLGGVHFNSTEDKEPSTDNVLQAIVQQVGDEVGNMAIIRAIAEIVRRDVLRLEIPHNLAEERAQDRYAELLKRDIPPIRDGLEELPPTLTVLKR